MLALFFRCSNVGSRLDLISIRGHGAEISLVASDSSYDGENSGTSLQMNLLARTIHEWLHQQCGGEHQDSNQSRRATTEMLLSYNWTYMVYSPLILLPPGIVTSMHSILTQNGFHEEVSSLSDLICENFRVTHIALNAPIPHTITARSSLHQSPNSLLSSSTLEPVRSTSTTILRSPTGLTPIYGDFGPSLPLTHTPTATDFTSAFWCTAQQNGIFQTWAPQYTMFSRGNISEKARVLKLESLSETTLGTKPENTSAVDLYAGIRYFAFSYAKAGVGKVLCWEVNPWSVKGLRRGAVRNEWGVSTVH